MQRPGLRNFNRLFDGRVLFVEDAEEMLSKLYKLDTAKGEKVTIDRSFLEDKRFETENVLHSYAHQLEIDIFQQKRLAYALAMCEYQKMCA